MAMTGGTAKLVKTGYGNYSSDGTKWPINLYVYYKSTQDTTKNESTVYVGMYVTTPNNYHIGPWVKTGDSYIGTTSLTFDGAIPYFTGTRWLAENKSFKVSHNTDGTGKATIYWKWAVNSSWAKMQNPSGSFEIDLPTIPRAAKITSAPESFTDLDNPTITFSNPGGFPMNVWLEPNPVGDHLCERINIPNIGSYTWQLTEDEREALRNSCADGRKNCPIRLGIYTDIGGTYYADYKDKTFIVKESDKTKPSVTTNVKLNNNLLPSKFANMYIQSKSKLDVTVTASGKYGASVKSLYGVVDGKTYNSNAFTTDVLNTSGNIDVIGYAKDSREFIGSATQPITVVAYSKPLLVPIGNALLCYRSDGNGLKVGKSTSLWVKAKMTHYPISSLNQCAMQWRWKKSNVEWDDRSHLWNDLIPKTSQSGKEYNGLISGTFDQKISFTVQIRAIDDVGEYDIKTFDIPTEDVALHLGKGGKNVSVGTYCDYSEEYTFYSDWKAIFDKGIHGVFKNVSVEGDLLEFAEGCDVGTTQISTNQGNTSLPSGNYVYAVGMVQRRESNQINIFLTDCLTGKIAINIYWYGEWSGWKYLTPQ